MKNDTGHEHLRVCFASNGALHVTFPANSDVKCRTRGSLDALGYQCVGVRLAVWVVKLFRILVKMALEAVHIVWRSARTSDGRKGTVLLVESEYAMATLTK
jgi:hypothetical protein